MSYNINGIRACLKKGIIKYIENSDCDYLFFSETKHTELNSIEELKEKYPFQYFNPSEKKGYSSTALLCKKEPLSVDFELKGAFDYKGRIITAHLTEKIVLVGLYVVNSQMKFARKKERIEFNRILTKHLKKYIENEKKELIVCGDLNCAYLETDLHNPDGERNKSPGFYNEERWEFANMLNIGLFDCFLYCYPEHLHAQDINIRKKGFTWYSAMSKMKKGGDRGWRIDHFLASENIKKHLKEFINDQSIDFSDHVPIIIKLDRSLFN